MKFFVDLDRNPNGTTGRTPHWADTDDPYAAVFAAYAEGHDVRRMPLIERAPAKDKEGGRCFNILVRTRSANHPWRFVADALVREA